MGPSGPTGSPVPIRPPSPDPSPPERDVRLVAAGVLSIVTGLMVSVLGGFLVWVIGTSPGSDDFIDLDGAFRALGSILLIAGVGYLVPGIGCVLGRQWGRIAAIVVNLLVGGVGVLSIVEDRVTPFAIVLIVWSGTILVLAVIGRPFRRA